MAKNKRAGKKKRRFLFSGRTWFWMFVFALVCGTVLFVVYGVWASTFDLKQVDDIPERSAVYDADGRFYARLAGENRVTVHLEDISPDLQHALMAREDSRFYSHHGIDPIGILRAAGRDLLHGRIREGGSTLTQQLALNTFLGGKHIHSISRKLLEACLAIRIEQNFTKKQIMEAYMNRIYFGDGVYGIETASQAYYGRQAKDLTLGQSAMLVGLIRSPSRYSPFKNLRRALAQRDLVLDRMVELKMITLAQANAAKSQGLALARKHGPAQENYALDAVRRDVDLLLNDDQVEAGGLKVYTTIDPQLQRAAEAAVDGQLQKVEERPGYDHPQRAAYAGQSLADQSGVPYLEGALVMIDNASGGIRALVGGRDYGESRFNRAIFAKRQVGSTFKPFVYAAAFSRGLQPSALIEDSPIRRGELRAAPNWSPGNSDGTYRGPMPAEDGLILSRNTMSVRVGDYAGISNVQAVAASAGLEDVPAQPSIFLGSFGETLKDLTSAYTVFPNEGLRRQSYVIERIDDADGQVIYRASHVSAPAIHPALADEMTSIMEQVLSRGTAAGSRSLGWRRPAAGKTGTTNDYRDAWFVGYTRSLTCGVWVGFDKPQVIEAKGYGAALALPIWVQAMNAAPPNRYPAPELGAPGQQAAPAIPVTHGIESLPGNILRSFRDFFNGH